MIYVQNTAIYMFFHWVNAAKHFLKYWIVQQWIFFSDVTNHESFQTLATQIEDIVKGEGLNVLLNNAGIAPKSTRLSFTKAEDLKETFETNTVAPVMLTAV